MVAGELKPDSGEVWLSQKTRIAYYEQGAEEKIDPELTVLQAAAQAGGGFTENELKGILGTFLFSGDAVDKRVSVLSGGERSRLAIIRALLTPSNLLILDEPTNHLDIQSREILFEAMSRYQRTIVFAAHDRFMLDKLADKTVRVEGGQAVLFPGNFTYASSRSRAASHKPQAASPKAVLRPQKSSSSSPVSGPGQQKGKGQRPKAKAQNHAAAVPRPTDPMARMQARLRAIEGEYEEARQTFDLNRARVLNDERKELLQELEARKADQVQNAGK